MKRITRSRRYRTLGGVCAGIALTYGVSITLVRLAALLLLSLGGVGIVVYLAAWLLLPVNPEPEPTSLPADPFLRSPENKMLGGVCGGLAELFAWDANLVRIAFVLLLVFFGLGVLPYIYAWAVVPMRPRTLVM